MEGDKIVINPKALLIPEFEIIYKNDRSANKKRSLSEFKYIYFMCDYKSEYDAYGLAKESQLGLELFNNKNYHPDKDVKAAIEKYQFLQDTLSMRYLVSMRNRVNKIIKFLDSAKLREKDGDQYINSFVDINKQMATMKQIEDVLEKIQKWEKIVFDEEEDMKIRGGGELNVFEDKENAVWLKKK